MLLQGAGPASQQGAGGWPVCGHPVRWTLVVREPCASLGSELQFCRQPAAGSGGVGQPGPEHAAYTQQTGRTFGWPSSALHRAAHAHMALAHRRGKCFEALKLEGLEPCSPGPPVCMPPECAGPRVRVTVCVHHCTCQSLRVSITACAGHRVCWSLCADSSQEAGWDTSAVASTPSLWAETGPHSRSRGRAHCEGRGPRGEGSHREARHPGTLGPPVHRAPPAQGRVREQLSPPTALETAARRPVPAAGGLS